jgi:hypothetical protein
MDVCYILHLQNVSIAQKKNKYEHSQNMDPHSFISNALY